MKKYAKLKVIFLCFLCGASTSALAQVIYAEPTGNYSGIFVEHGIKNASLLLRKNETIQSAPSRRDFTKFHFILMTPGKNIGFGVELSYLMFQQLESNFADVHSLPQNGWDGITIVGKYQFGIYRHYRLFNKTRLAKAIAAFILKLNWNNSMPGQKDESENVLFPSRGSKNLSAGLAFHTDTARYFRIHGHLNATFPLSKEKVHPSAIYHVHLSFLPARLGIRELYYPFFGFTGRYIRGKKISPVGTTSFAFLTGMQSTWKYLSVYHTFIKLELGAQLRAYTCPTAVLTGPAFALYFGTRFYFR